MAAVTRSNSRVAPPVYKDYVNFLAGYKNGKKDDENIGVSDKSLSLTSSSSSISSDSTDFSKSSVTPYNTYLQNSKTKKFSPVKPKLEDNKQTKIKDKEEKTIKKSEIYIEIQPTKSVSEVSKIFENQKSPTSSKINKLNSKISIFEKQTSAKCYKSPPAKIDIFEGQNPPPIKGPSPLSPKPLILPPIKVQSPPPAISLTLLPAKLLTAPPAKPLTPPPSKPLTPPPSKPLTPPPKVTLPEAQSNGVTELPPPPPPMPSSQPQNLAAKRSVTIGNNTPPPPPPPSSVNSPPVKLQATLIKGPQTKFTVHNANGTVPEIDRNNPLVKKLVYGTLRGLYGAYHDQASDMLATLPKNMVVRSNGVQDRIEQIAANGDLEKLNGRVNPRVDQE